MNMRRIVFAVLLSVLTCSLAVAQAYTLPRSAPEAQGVESQAVIDFFDAMTTLPEGTESHSAIVMRNGKVIGEIYPEPFRPQYSQTLYSASKTFVAVAVGLAVDRGLLKVTDRVADFFPDQLPDSVSDNLKAMTVQNLLTMTSGIKPDWAMRNKTDDWVRTFLALPVTDKPGTKMQYDSMVTYMLSAIVQKVTGMTTLDFLKEHLLTLMGITQVDWELSPEGINTGGWGLHIQPESMAKFGQLLLDKGRWDDRQLVSEQWVTDMMTPRYVYSNGEGYGYQIWQCEYPGAWRCDGAMGQYIVVLPAENMVVVITEASLLKGPESRGPIWNKLMPGVKDHALQPSETAAQLAEKQQTYRLEPVQGKKKSKYSKFLDNRTITLAENNKLEWKSITPHFRSGKLTLDIVKADGTAYRAVCQHGKWDTTVTQATPPYSIKARGRFNGIEPKFFVDGSFAWTAGNTLTVKLFYTNWISSLELTFQLPDDVAKKSDAAYGLTVSVKENTLKNAYDVAGTVEP